MVFACDPTHMCSDPVFATVLFDSELTQSTSHTTTQSTQCLQEGHKLFVMRASNLGILNSNLGILNGVLCFHALFLQVLPGRHCLLVTLLSLLLLQERTALG